MPKIYCGDSFFVSQARKAKHTGKYISINSISDLNTLNPFSINNNNIVLNVFNESHYPKNIPDLKNLYIYAYDFSVEEYTRNYEFSSSEKSVLHKKYHNYFIKKYGFDLKINYSFRSIGDRFYVNYWDTDLSFKNYELTGNKLINVSTQEHPLLSYLKNGDLRNSLFKLSYNLNYNSNNLNYLNNLISCNNTKQLLKTMEIINQALFKLDSGANENYVICKIMLELNALKGKQVTN